MPACPSPVGSLCTNIPPHVSSPPIEAVVFGWGASEDRQLGLDSEQNVMQPKVVESLLGIQFRGREFARSPLVSGSRNTVSIDADGQLWSWGWNDRGTLGHGHSLPEHKPMRVSGLKNVRIVQAAIGGWHCLALSDRGVVFAWGGNEYNQCGVSPELRDIVLPEPCVPFLKVKQVACGGMHSLVLTEEGEMWTWGEPWGDFSLNTQRNPRKVPFEQNVAAVACGAFHNLALTSAGAVYSWGTNDYGQLGNGDTIYSTEPTKVVDLDDVLIADVTAGGWHSVALSVDGEVFIWGRGEYGRLGNGDKTGCSKLRPQLVSGLQGHVIVQAAAGGTHTMALSHTGRVFIWGRCSYGRLGLSSTYDRYVPVELSLPGGRERWRVAAISAGGRHSMLLAVPQRDRLSEEPLPVAGAPPLQQITSLGALQRLTQGLSLQDIEGALQPGTSPQRLLLQQQQQHLHSADSGSLRVGRVPSWANLQGAPPGAEAASPSGHAGIGTSAGLGSKGEEGDEEDVDEDEVEGGSEMELTRGNSADAGSPSNELHFDSGLGDRLVNGLEERLSVHQNAHS